MASKYRISKSTLNVHGTPTLVHLTEWAKLRLSGDQLDEFFADSQQFDELMTSHLNNGTLEIREILGEHGQEISRECYFQEDVHPPEYYLKWMTMMQQDPEIIIFKPLEYL